MVDDDAVDRIIFNTDPDEDSNSYKSSGSNLGYTTVSNFDATDDFDKFGLYYGDTSAFTSYKNASKTSDGVVAVTQDSIILEEDNSPVYSAGTAGFDTVDEIKSMIAGTITSVSNSSDKIAYIQYGHDQRTLKPILILLPLSWRVLKVHLTSNPMTALQFYLLHDCLKLVVRK